MQDTKDRGVFYRFILYLSLLYQLKKQRWEDICVHLLIWRVPANQLLRGGLLCPITSFCLLVVDAVICAFVLIELLY